LSSIPAYGLGGGLLVAALRLTEYRFLVVAGSELALRPTALLDPHPVGDVTGAGTVR
jgi:hypothetical protein